MGFWSERTGLRKGPRPFSTSAGMGSWLTRRLPICLETTQPRVRRLYRYAGYTEYAVRRHPYADLDIYFFIKHHDDV